jgi:hypothetical protein
MKKNKEANHPSALIVHLTSEAFQGWVALGGRLKRLITKLEELDAMPQGGSKEESVKWALGTAGLVEQLGRFVLDHTTDEGTRAGMARVQIKVEVPAGTGVRVLDTGKVQVSLDAVVNFIGTLVMSLATSALIPMDKMVKDILAHKVRCPVEAGMPPVPPPDTGAMGLHWEELARLAKQQNPNN